MWQRWLQSPLMKDKWVNLMAFHKRQRSVYHLVNIMGNDELAVQKATTSVGYDLWKVKLELK